MHNKLKTKLTPSLRFPEFSGEWEQKRLGEIVRISKGSGISKSDITSEGQYPCIRYGELYTRYSEVITEVFSKTNLRDKSSVISGENDLLIPSSGETALDIARTSHVVPKNVLLGGDMTILSLEKNDSGFFFAYYLSNGKKKEIAKLAQGNSVVHIYGSHLKTLEITRPSTEEQQRIASFLTTVDDWIENLKKQKAAQEKYKKGMMQKIFFQEIRFQNDEGKEYPEWEQKRLGDVCQQPAYGMNAPAREFDGENIYLRITDIDPKTNQLKRKNLTSPGTSLEDAYLLKEGDLLFARTGASTGKTYMYKSMDGKIYFAGFLIKFLVDKANVRFIFYSTQTRRYLNWVMSVSARSGQPGINAKEYSNYSLQIPDAQEQKKISDFLSSIDDLINLSNQRITLAEEWKKGLMQRVFV